MRASKVVIFNQRSFDHCIWCLELFELKASTVFYFYISWTHLTKLYEKIRTESGLSLIPKIKYKHNKLTCFSKIEVDLTIQVRNNIKN